MSLVCSALNWSMWCRAVVRFPLGTGSYWLQYFRTSLATTLGCSASAIWLFGAARMGLYRLTQSLGLSAQDQVILPAYTCVVVPNALHFAGANVRYVDIDPQTLDFDFDALLAACDEHTKMIVLPANFGMQGAADQMMSRLDRLRERYPQAILVADMAHALTSAKAGQADLGQQADAAFYSFEFSKCITTGMGGALRINRPDLQHRYEQFDQQAAPLPAPSALTQFRQMTTVKTHLLGASGWPRLGRWSQGILRRLRLLFATPAAELAGQMPTGYPSAMSPFGACLGVQQLTDYATTEALRRQQAGQYVAALSAVTAIEIPAIGAEDTLLRFPFMLSDQAVARGWTRPAFMAHIKARTGIQLGSWFNHVVHPTGSHGHGYQEGSCPVGERVASRMMNLPLGRHVRLDDARLKQLRAAMDEVSA
ncbi:aminotransferase class I/II-fold pyridoxal phosphate-dependent enzyme [Leeia oryzae]|uniref:aminotransferase class I/II-fold pyridoxal phosphate-dependent enzyme n=1 Tax=Leeia oryzae TaxID=356662 RepID=UPI00036B2059|nr:aminotransferase class I/II-fold pyridoxal phosphate-dependent enzyme [Leeia oryzae]